MARLSSRTPIVLMAVLTSLAGACDHYAAADVGETPAVAPRLTPAPAVPSPPEGVLACGPAELDPPQVVDPLRRSDGTCVPPGAAVVYRCDPSLDPVAVLDLGDDPRRFLGGAFAVPLTELPADARRIGVAAVGRIYEVPTVPPMLVVEAAGGYERWLALPEAPFVGPSPAGMVIGDSIADGASLMLEERLPSWTLTIDAEIGRASYHGAVIAEEMEGVPDAVVFELGVNDTSADTFSANAARAVDAVGDADLVVWVTAHGPGSETDGVNRAVVATMGGLSNGLVADWDRSVPPEALSSDGVHLLDGSGVVFADFLAPLLETWRQAVDGHGPDRCGAAIEASV